jgi:hypothetical protein
MEMFLTLWRTQRRKTAKAQSYGLMMQNLSVHRLTRCFLRRMRTRYVLVGTLAR